MAILLREPEAAIMVDALSRSPRNLLSAGTWIELGAVLTRRRRPELFDLLAEVVESASIWIQPMSVEQGKIGYDAYRQYGIGALSKAKLNLGDCFAYALAKTTGEPLLFKGDDFIHTDITSALARPSG